MKGTETFKKVIKAYLDKRAAEDELFAKDYAKPGKNIDDCCDFIISEVKKSGRQGFDDDEIYGIAVHYYNEEEVYSPRIRIALLLQISQTRPRRIWRRKLRRSSSKPRSWSSKRRSPQRRNA